MIDPIESQPLHSKTSIVQSMRPQILNKPGSKEMATMNLRGNNQIEIGNRTRIANQPLRALITSEQVWGVPPRLPHNKSYFERFFEYLISDGPNSRYALICKNCSTHNGMTLVEEFEYTAFKCYVCQFFNPARKQRPVAPKLETDRFVADDQSDTDKTSSSLRSDAGSLEIEEIEEVDREMFIEDIGSRTNVNEMDEAPVETDASELTEGNNNLSLLSFEEANSSGKTLQLEGNREDSTEKLETEPENNSTPRKSADVFN